MYRWKTLAVLGLVFMLGAAEKNEKTDLKISQEEQAVLDLTNQAREKEKLPPLKPNALLFQAARAHSENMATQKKLDHVLDDKKPAERVKAAGYNYSFVGENIGHSPLPGAESVFQLWMKSKLHRENILDKSKFDEIGIGLARDDKGEVYYTQVFGKKRR